MQAVLAEKWTLTENCRVGVSQNKPMIYAVWSKRSILEHPLQGEQMAKHCETRSYGWKIDRIKRLQLANAPIHIPDLTYFGNAV